MSILKKTGMNIVIHPVHSRPHLAKLKTDKLNDTIDIEDVDTIIEEFKNLRYVMVTAKAKLEKKEGV